MGTNLVKVRSDAETLTGTEEEENGTILRHKKIRRQQGPEEEEEKEEETQNEVMDTIRRGSSP